MRLCIVKNMKHDMVEVVSDFSPCAEDDGIPGELANKSLKPRSRKTSKMCLQRVN